MTLNPNDVKVTKNWANFMLFVQREVPFGDIKVKFVNGEPIEPIEWRRKIRFDKVETLPKYSPAIDNEP